MEISGKVEQLLELVSGTSAKGEWKKRDIVISTVEQFPKKVCLTLWGNLVDNSDALLGQLLIFDIQMQSREYNSRWYTDVRVLNFAKQLSGNTLSKEALNPKIPPANLYVNDDDGELPF